MPTAAHTRTREFIHTSNGKVKTMRPFLRFVRARAERCRHPDLKVFGLRLECSAFGHGQRKISARWYVALARRSGSASTCTGTFRDGGHSRTGVEGRRACALALTNWSVPREMLPTRLGALPVSSLENGHDASLRRRSSRSLDDLKTRNRVDIVARYRLCEIRYRSNAHSRATTWCLPSGAPAGAAGNAGLSVLTAWRRRRKAVA